MPVKVLWNALFVAITLAALGGCAADSVKGVFQSKGKPELATGLNRSEQVTAHKYLAFIHCTSGREKQCRDEFRKVLDIDPALELEPAEAGHPVWGPVFRSVKARR